MTDWIGELDITVFKKGQQSVARNIYFQGALKVIRPIYLNGSNIPTFYISNVGGGFLDGDRYRMKINVLENAALSLTSQGATKIYKTLNDHVEQYQTFELKDGAYMDYVADPIIAYKHAKYYQKNVFHLSKTASLFYTDIITPGYDEEGSHFTYEWMHLLSEIYVDNELVVYDNLKLVPNKIEVRELGYMEGFTHYGSCYFIHPEVDQQFVDDVMNIIRDKHVDNRVGISLMATHGFSVRILSNQTQQIEQVLLLIQNYINRRLYQRNVEFLRKY